MDESSYQLRGYHLASVVGISDAKITKFGKENVGELLRLFDSFVEDFIEREGMNPFHYFRKKYQFRSLTPKDIAELKPYIKPKWYDGLIKGYRFHVKQYNKYLSDLERYEKKDPSMVSWTPKDFSSKKEYNERYKEVQEGTLYFFNYDYRFKELGESRSGRKFTIPFEFVPQLIEEAFEGFCNQLLRECENLLRKKKKMPRIGEGWIGETQLYYALKEAYPQETVTNHARPHWLGRQHLDIYFPERNLAIEYQGAQHDRPVAFFGGEEQFLAQQERDERKARLCKENGCRLLYVREGYDFKELQRDIESSLSFVK